MAFQKIIKGAFLKVALASRAFLTRALRPAGRYFLFPAGEKRTCPIGDKTGFDRGKPIDRYYIEKFLEENSSLIRGRALEIHDKAYVERFGGDGVARADALDIDRKNLEADIYGDLRDLSGVIPDEQYDCLVITQTFGMIDDFFSAMRECHRILKPGGALLATSSSLAPCLDIENSYWRFTSASFRYSLEKFFRPENVRVRTYGNVLSGQAFWTGMAQEDLDPSRLEKDDPRFPIIVCAVAIKS
jgi:SAM-dependent methyltransferase